MPFAYHLWESVAYKRFLASYDPERIHDRDGKGGGDGRELRDENSFSREVRRFVSDEFRAAWREARAQGLVDT